MNFPSPIKEDLVQYAWKTKCIDTSDLKTTNGESISIKNWGYHNLDSGPDFSTGRIVINGIEWSGNIEMHVISSMWYQHKHHMDDAYNNVILHVVYEHDREVYRKDGTLIPTLEVKSLIPDTIRRNYLSLIQNHAWVPCQNIFPVISELELNLWLNKLMVERLERKTEAIAHIFEQSRSDWEQTTFILASRYMGSQINGLPMEMLASSLDVKILYKNISNPLSVEALLFGQAGLLDSSFNDSFPTELRKEYDFLKKKYKLKSLDPSIWKFGRLRPPNFPTIRIALLAQLLIKNGQLFRNIIDVKSSEELKRLFEVQASEYWDNHYTFKKPSRRMVKKISKGFVDLFCINVVSPLLFYYGIKIGEESFKEKSISLLESIKAEKNVIINNWKEIGIKAKTADQSQALIQLKKNYCNETKCLNCRIGHKLLNQK